MREPENIGEVAAMAPDMMGFIFYAGSPRFAGGLTAEAVKALPATVKSVGVFVDAGAEEIASVAGKYALSAVQLHGSESPGLCAQMRDRGLYVIKAVAVVREEDITATQAYEGVCDALLFDTKGVGRGGTGRKFDWDLLRAYRGTLPFILSGGIGPEDGGALAEFAHPMWAGVDLNSRFEVLPGVKDTGLLREAIGAVRAL